MVEVVQVSLPPRTAAALGQSALAVRGPSADHSVVGIIRSTGSYEPHVMEAIIDKVPVGGTFIDMGANIGVHSLLAALRSGREGKVLALEASPVTFPILVDNLASAGCPGAVAVNVAVWDAPGIIAFSHIPHIIGGSHVNPTADENWQVFTVPCDSLDNLAEKAGLERVDLIKIDVEGSEIRALLGAQATLSRYKPPIIVEFNPLTLREYGSSSVLDLYQCLCDLGYGMKILHEDGSIIPVTDYGQMERISLQWSLRLDVLCEHPS
jgi:FkbM family methyltransferase